MVSPTYALRGVCVRAAVDCDKPRSQNQMSYPATSYSNRSIFFGAFLIVLGLALIVVAVGISNDGPMFALGGFAVLGGVLRLTTALARDARFRREHPFDPDDPRWNGGSGLVQLAGKPCAECGAKITVAYEAFCCEACIRPVHLDGRELHHAHAHAMAPSWATLEPR